MPVLSNAATSRRAASPWPNSALKNPTTFTPGSADLRWSSMAASLLRLLRSEGRPPPGSVHNRPGARPTHELSLGLLFGSRSPDAGRGNSRDAAACRRRDHRRGRRRRARGGVSRPRGDRGPGVPRLFRTSLRALLAVAAQPLWRGLGLPHRRRRSSKRGSRGVHRRPLTRSAMSSNTGFRDAGSSMTLVIGCPESRGIRTTRSGSSETTRRRFASAARCTRPPSQCCPPTFSRSRSTTSRCSSHRSKNVRRGFDTTRRLRALRGESTIRASTCRSSAITARWPRRLQMTER